MGGRNRSWCLGKGVPSSIPPLQDWMSWKTPHQVSPKGLGQDHLLLQLLLDVLSREYHALGGRNRAGLWEASWNRTASDLTSAPFHPSTNRPWVLLWLHFQLHCPSEKMEVQRKVSLPDRDRCDVSPAACPGASRDSWRPLGLSGQPDQTTFFWLIWAKGRSHCQPQTPECCQGSGVGEQR